jgi:hypothetical protein
VHVAGTDGPDETLAGPLSDRENQEHVPTFVGPPYGPEALLGERVLHIHADRVGPREQALDLRDRHAVLLALSAVSLVPVEAGNGSMHEIRMYVCPYNLSRRISIS